MVNISLFCEGGVIEGGVGGNVLYRSWVHPQIGGKTFARKVRSECDHDGYDMARLIRTGDR